jgi:predicted NACHT family NTPase
MSDWIHRFLAECPDGKVVITCLNNRSSKQGKPHRRKVKTVTNEGEIYVQGH